MLVSVPILSSLLAKEFMITKIFFVRSAVTQSNKTPLIAAGIFHVKPNYQLWFA